MIEDFQALKDSGIETIFTLRWPFDDPNNTEEIDSDRIPTGTDLLSSLELLRTFLIELDTLIDYYQLQNEPIGGPGVYFERVVSTSEAVLSGFNAVRWLDTLAFTARQTIDQNNLGIRIITPGITGVDLAAAGDAVNSFTYINDNLDTVRNSNYPEYFIPKIVNTGINYCDAIDIHLNRMGIEDLVLFIDYVDSVRSALNGEGIPFVTL